MHDKTDSSQIPAAPLTEVRQPAQAVPETLVPFRALFESAPGCHLVITPDNYRILAVSDAYLEATMTERAALLGRYVFDVFPDAPGDPNATGEHNLTASLEYVRSHGVRHEMAMQRYPIPRPAALGGGFEERYWRAVNTPVKAPDGSLTCILHSIEDVTSFIGVETGEALRRSEERASHLQQDMLAARHEALDIAQRLHHTLEQISDAFYLLDRNGRFAYLNTVAEHMLQCPRGALVGRYVWDCFPDAIATVKPAYDLAISSGQWQQLTIYFPPLGTWLEIRAYPGSEGLAVYFRDVGTERARQEQLRLLETAVSRQSDILLITEANSIEAPEGPRIVYVNDAFVRRTGYSRDEAIGNTPRMLQGPKTERRELDRIRTALERQEPVRAELIDYTKGGEELWLEIDIVPIVDAEGQLTHWVSVQRDVTERHLLEERLRQSQKLEAVGQLTGGIAHDFNNLLTVILGNAELLVEQLANQPTLRSLAEITSTAAERGSQLTSRLLAFARRQALAPKQVDINHLLQGMDGLLRRTLTENIDIELVEGNDLWTADVDPGQLEAALLNLAINARDAMPGGGRLTIETGNVHLDAASVAAQPELLPGDYVLVSVSDTGSGMPPEVVARAFEPFFTTKEVGKGSGLGLSMVYGFVRQSRGNVRIYSEPGEGTSIYLYFPRTMSNTASTSESLGNSVVAGGSEHILVVEDDPLVRHHVIALLQGLGYRITSASSAPQALLMLQENQDIDLLFTDVIMPGGINGRELARAAQRLRPQMKALYTSGYSESAIIHHGRLDPGVELLSKPYRRQELAMKIRKVLDAPATDTG